MTRILGCLWVLLGVFLFSFVFSIPKLFSPAVPLIQVAFLRYLTGFLVTTPFYALEKTRTAREGAASQTIHFRLHLLRATLGILTILCIIYAAERISIVRVQVLSLTNGIFVLFFSMVFLKEQVRPKTIISAILCLSGVVVAAEPATGGGTGWISQGTLVALFAAIFWAGEVIVLKVTASRESPAQILYVVNGTATCLLCIPALLTWHPIETNHFLLLCLMGPLAIFAQFCNIKGFRLTEANILVPIRYCSVVSSSLVGYLFFGEIPGLTVLLGGSLVVSGGVFVSLSMLRSHG